MIKSTYLKCRNPVMTFLDPQTKFKIPRGRIVKLEGKLTKTMQKWIRRGGLKVVEEEMYQTQQNAEPRAKLTKPVNPVPKKVALDPKEPSPEGEEPEAEKIKVKKPRKLRKKKTGDS